MSFNTTINTHCNYIKTSENEPFRVTIKITGLIAHGLYLLLVICFKQLRGKQLVFLNNYNVVATLIVIYSLYREFYLCVTRISCIIEGLGLFFFIGLESYSITLLLAFRFICILTDKAYKILKWKYLCPILISFYVFVFLLTVICYISTDTDVIYVRGPSRCAVLSRNQIFIYLMIVLNNLIPSFLSIFGAFWIILRLKAKTSSIVPNENEFDARTAKKKASSSNQSAFELSWQIIILTFSFQMFSISNLLLISNGSFGFNFLTAQHIEILRYIRWSAFIVDSIALYTFNPLIKNFFKGLWKQLKYFFSQ
jgi:hypothetical protein